MNGTPVPVKSARGAIIVLTACVCAMTACDRVATALQPSPLVTTAVTTGPPTLFLFTDSATGVATDVYDAQSRIVRFNTGRPAQL